jgi:transcription antitermination protein NusB
MSRKTARETAMKTLFQMEINEEYELDRINMGDKEDIEENDIKYMEGLIRGVVSNLDKIDKTIEKYSKSWKLSRLPKVDLSILRIALYELMYLEDIPMQVSVNEAVEIAKKYSTGESSKFINGLLGAYIKEESGSDD